MNEPTWKNTLDPFAQEWSKLDNLLREHVVALSDHELQRLLIDTKKPTQTNCWYATFRVAPLVAAAVTAEQRGRRFKALQAALSARSTEEADDAEG